jgi:transposase
VANEALVSDELWEAIEPYLPPERPPLGGRPRVPDRAALGGIIYVLRHGLRWRDLPRELGYGSGVTCWRRLRRWQDLGVWEAVHHTLLNWLGLLDAIRWERASLDSTSVRAKRGGEATGPNPTDRGKPGTKYHLVVDQQGVPLAVALSAANVHDSRLLEPLVDAIPPVWRQRSSTGTRATTTPRSGGPCGAGASSRASPGAGWSPASASVDTAGRWSARSPGSPPSAG